MNYRRLLHSTFMLAMGLATIGSTGSQRKMPPPRVFAAISIVWWVLGVVADMGPRLARLAGIFSVVLTLTMLTGKAGARAIAWLNERSAVFGGAGAGSPSSAGTTGVTGAFSQVEQAFQGAAGAVSHAGIAIRPRTR